MYLYKTIRNTLYVFLSHDLENFILNVEIVYSRRYFFVLQIFFFINNYIRIHHSEYLFNLIHCLLLSIRR